MLPGADRPVVKVLGFSLRKRRYLRGFLPGRRLQAVRSVSELRPGDTVAVWASHPLRQAAEALPEVTVLRVEDGFLRSVGLGAQLAQPLSWVVDSLGIYYDPAGPSELETLLETARFDPQQIARACELRKRIVAARLSKYNVGSSRWPGLSSRRAPAQPVVLVVGQVENDASVRSGAGAINTNVGLLRAARAHHPDAWLVYKPHPDVVAGLRGAGENEGAASTMCDEIVAQAPIERLLDMVDAVHVITSLSGFEALLRGKAVYCHGLPFYAGWGLTHDSVTTSRRTRRLTLDELCAAALIAYPRYIDRATGRPCSAEEAVESLVDWRRRDDGALRWWHRLLKPLLRHE